MMWTQLSGYLIDCKKLRKTLVVNSEVSFLQTKFFFNCELSRELAATDLD